MRAKGEGSIYHVDGKGWCAQLDIGWSATGARRYRRRFRPSRTAAAQVLERMRRERDRGLDLTDQTLGDYLAAWIVAIEPSRAPKTVAAYRSDVGHVVDAIGDVPLAKLRPQHVRVMLAGIDRAPKTVRNIRATLRTAMQDATRDRLLEWNPVDSTDPPRVPRPKIRPASADEVAVLLDALESDRFRALWSVKVAVGLRLGEALGLTWDHVDLDDGVVRVRHQLRRERGHYVLRDLKTPKRIRDVPLGGFAVDALRDHRRDQAAERLAAERWPDGCGDECHETGWGLVFTTHSPRSVGRPLTDTVPRNSLAEVSTDAIGRRLKPHDLRHTAATLMLAAGVPIAHVSAILGHSSIQVTVDRYGHLELDHLRPAAAKIHGLVSVPR